MINVRLSSHQRAVAWRTVACAARRPPREQRTRRSPKTNNRITKLESRTLRITKAVSRPVRGAHPWVRRQFRGVKLPCTKFLCFYLVVSLGSWPAWLFVVPLSRSVASGAHRARPPIHTATSPCTHTHRRGAQDQLASPDRRSPCIEDHLASPDQPQGADSHLAHR